MFRRRFRTFPECIITLYKGIYIIGKRLWVGIKSYLNLSVLIGSRFRMQSDFICIIDPESIAIGRLGFTIYCIGSISCWLNVFVKTKVMYHAAAVRGIVICNAEMFIAFCRNTISIRGNLQGTAAAVVLKYLGMYTQVRIVDQTHKSVLQGIMCIARL